MNFGSMSTCHCEASGGAAHTRALVTSSKSAGNKILSIKIRWPKIEKLMITFLEGTLVEALPTQIVVAVNGVGYQVQIPLSSFDRLPAPGSPLKILTHLQVRED